MDRRIVVVAALALGGCSLRLDTKDLDPLRSVETFCQTLFGEYLVQERDCTGWTQEFLDYEYGRTLQLCAGIAWSHSQGRVGYDRGVAATCLAGVREASCTTDAGRAMDACKAAIPGTRRNGDDCNDDVECADPQATCAFVAPACPGACLAPGKLGDKCGAGYPACATGFRCNGTTALCETADPENSVCTTLNEWRCGENARCIGGVCVRLAMEGEPCSATKPCGSTKSGDLFCDEHNAFDGGPWVCRRYMTIPVGGRCEGTYECDLAGWCDLATAPGTCKARLGAGSPCMGDSMCARPLACVGDNMSGTPTNGVCNPRLSPGILCEPTSADCQVGAACIPSGTYTCQHWPSQIGGACGAHPFEKFCYVGRCAGVAAAPTCQDWLPPASTCTSDDECGPFGGMGGPRCELTESTQRQCIPACLAR